jgi:hypothetical protein
MQSKSVQRRLALQKTGRSLDELLDERLLLAQAVLQHSVDYHYYNLQAKELAERVLAEKEKRAD